MLLFSFALAGPDAPSLREAWESVDASAWVYRPEFSDKEFARLAQGKVVKRRERLDGPDRVLAALWTPSKRDPLWVSIQDENHWVIVDGYVDEDLPGSTFHDRTLYQRIGLPWPFADRQWVIDVKSNRTLLTVSSDTIWERAWSLSTRRGATVEEPDAVWIDRNDGAWVLADAEGGTLLVYHVRATVGGNIPDEAATQWSLMTVSSMIEDVNSRATSEVPTHYNGNHALIERPDGSQIPVYD